MPIESDLWAQRWPDLLGRQDLEFRLRDSVKRGPSADWEDKVPKSCPKMGEDRTYMH